MSGDAISATWFLILQFAQVKLFIAIVCRCKENGGRARMSGGDVNVGSRGTEQRRESRDENVRWE